MTASAIALERYEAALAAGRADELAATATALDALIEASGTDEDVAPLCAASLHLRTLGALNQPHCFDIETHLAAIGGLCEQRPSGIASAVRAIVTYCSYYSSRDRTRISQALSLFADLEPDPDFPRLRTACLINELLAQKIALERDLPDHSVDRVEVLVDELRSGDLPVRFSRLVDAAVSEFYLRLALRYQDLRFVRQGLRLVETGTRSTDQGIADGALAAVWTLAIHGLENDPEFMIEREWIRAGQTRLRSYRLSARQEDDMDLSRLAHCMGLWARFDYERRGKRTGVLRALGYCRIAAARTHYLYSLATTMRVAFEAGLGEQYLDMSLTTFVAAIADPTSPPDHSDHANYASTLMLVGIHRRDREALILAIELYRGAIAGQPRSAINVSRLINLASAAWHYVTLCEMQEPFDDPECAALLDRGLDAIIEASILDRPDSTHNKLCRSNLAAYRTLYEYRLGVKGAVERILQRSLELMAGLEEVWPVGFTLFVADRLREAAACDDIDCRLLSSAAKALAKAKFMLQVVDLCDGGDRHTRRAIDALFRAGTAVLAAHFTQSHDSAGLAALDNLTGGFVSRAARHRTIAADERAASAITRAMSGVPLDPREVALIRRSPLGALLEEGVDRTPEAAVSDLVLLDLLAVGSDVVVLRRNADGLAARMIAVARPDAPGALAEVGSEASAFAGEAAEPLWLSLRNFPPARGHVLFQHIRAAVEASAPKRLVLQRTGRTLDHSGLARGLLRDQARLLYAHSPANDAPPLQFGFQVAERLRALMGVTELALGDCGRAQIASRLPDADILVIFSHGERASAGQPDRILLAAQETVTAEWLLSLGPALADKWVFLVACNSGHFNARLTHDDIGFGALAVAVGARGSFVTLHSVDELSMAMLLVRAFGLWDQQRSLPAAMALARQQLIGFDEAGFGADHRALIGGGMAARAAYRRLNPASAEASQSYSDRRHDIDCGWAMLCD